MSDNFDEEKATWKKRLDETEITNVWINIVLHFFLLIISLSVLILIPIFYKRKECFLLAIPTVFMAEAIFKLWYYFLFIYQEDEPFDYHVYLDIVYNFSYDLGHLLFSSQYL